MSGFDKTRLSAESERLKAQAATVPAELPPSPVPDLVLEKELGRGGMGVVYQARQTYLERTVALKLLLTPGGPAAEEFVRRFQREAKILATLNHPHIVGCYQAGLTAAGTPYLAMEFIDGPNLAEWVAHRGPLAPDLAVLVIRDLALALDHAHLQGIIHRDVKPENVLLARRPQAAANDPFPWTVKLADLGLARPAGAGDMQLTRQGTIVGTPATMAPEQFEDPEGVDFRADIYGLGCILFHILTGQPAFTASTIGQLLTSKLHAPVPDPGSLRDLPRPVRDLTLGLLARDRQARPTSYGDLVRRCDLAAAGSQVRPKAPIARWVGVGAGLLALGGSAWLFLVPHAVPPTAPAPVAPTAVAATAAAAPAAATPGTGTVPPGSGTGKSPPIPPVAIPPAPVTPPARPLSEVPFGPAKPVWLFDQARRLGDWSVQGGGLWTSAEERADAVAGTTGRTWRTLTEPLPWRITAQIHLANRGPGRRSDLAQIGVVLADGSTAGLTVINLGTLFHTQVNRYLAADPMFAVQTFGPHTMEVAEAVEVTLLVGEDALIAAAAGPFDKTPLPSRPVGLYLGAQGTKAPVEISGLRLQTAQGQ